MVPGHVYHGYAAGRQPLPAVGWAREHAAGSAMDMRSRLWHLLGSFQECDIAIQLFVAIVQCCLVVSVGYLVEPSDELG